MFDTCMNTDPDSPMFRLLGVVDLPRELRIDHLCHSTPKDGSNRAVEVKVVEAVEEIQLNNGTLPCQCIKQSVVVGVFDNELRFDSVPDNAKQRSRVFERFCYHQVVLAVAYETGLEVGQMNLLVVVKAGGATSGTHKCYVLKAISPEAALHVCEALQKTLSEIQTKALGIRKRPATASGDSTRIYLSRDSS